MRKTVFECITFLADLNAPKLPESDRDKLRFAIYCVGQSDPVPVERREYMGVAFGPTCPRCQGRLTTIKPRFCEHCGGALNWRNYK